MRTERAPAAEGGCLDSKDDETRTFLGTCNIDNIIFNYFGAAGHFCSFCLLSLPMKKYAELYSPWVKRIEYILFVKN